MNIVADENITFIHEVFDGLGEVKTYAGRSITAEQVKDADVLLVRSVTQVNEGLLSGSNVKFVGTCTIGTDHIDQSYLEQQNIGFSAAPGCNANAVVDYVISTLVVLAQQQGFDLFERSVGIVGVGNVGSRLKKRLQALGIRCLCNDPLHDDQEVAGLVHLDQLIAEADVISIHTPLTFDGEHPTHHLFNTSTLAQLKPNTILINTGRGPVIDNQALTSFLKQRADVTAVLDVWEHEPEVDLPLLAQVTLATPHIAGYSFDGKVGGTGMIYEALCRYFKLPERLDVQALAPAAMPIKCDVAKGLSAVFEAVLSCYDVRADDARFRQQMVSENNQRADSFDALRKNYPLRRELGVTAVADGVGKLQSLLRAFGFMC